MTERNPTVVVTSDETLPDIVGRLREAANGGRTVDLVIPIDSALLLTAREFRTLKDAIDEDRVAVQMRTADPLRLQLAGRLGIPARALPRPRVVASTAPIAAEPPQVVVEPPPVSDEDWPGQTAVTEPVVRPSPESHWPSQNGLSGEGDEAEEDDGAGHGVSRRAAFPRFAEPSSLSIPPGPRHEPNHRSDPAGRS